MIKKYQLKSGETRWLIKVYLGVNHLTGKEMRTTRRGFKTRKEAQIAEGKLLEASKPAQPQTMTIKDVVKQYQQYHVSKLKESTQKNVNTDLNNRIIPLLGNAKLAALTAPELQAVVNKHLSSNCTRILKSLLHFAYKKDMLTDNIAGKLEKPRPKKKNRKAYFLTKKQVVQFFDNITAGEMTFKKWRTLAIVRLLVYSGLRIGEFCALRWSDLDGNKLTINKTYTFTLNKVLDSPKTKTSNRVIILDDTTLKILRDFRQRQLIYLRHHGVKENFMFTSMNGKVMNRESIMISLNTYNQGLPRINPHMLRHTHASLLFAAGVPIKEIQARLGHSSIKVTMDIYTHIMPNQATSGVDKLVAFMNGTESKP